MTHIAEKQDITAEIIRVISELQNGSGYGAIEITLHEGRVTLIEKREKLRFIKDHKTIFKQTTTATLNAQSTVTTEKIN